MSFTAAIGWVGVISFVVAYALLSLGRLRSDRNNYHLLNAIGGLCLIINAYSYADIPTLTVNLVWMLIALASMIRVSAADKNSGVKSLH